MVKFSQKLSNIFWSREFLFDNEVKNNKDTKAMTAKTKTMVRVLGLSDPFMEQTGFLTVNILGKSTTNWNFYQGEEKDIPSSNWTFSVNSFHSWVLTDLILSVIYCDIHQEMMMVMKLTNLARGSKVKLHPWVSDGGWLLDNLRPGVSLWPSSLPYHTMVAYHTQTNPTIPDHIKTRLLNNLHLPNQPYPFPIRLVTVTIGFQKCHH